MAEKPFFPSQGGSYVIPTPGADPQLVSRTDSGTINGEPEQVAPKAQQKPAKGGKGEGE